MLHNKIQEMQSLVDLNSQEKTDKIKHLEEVLEKKDEFRRLSLDIKEQEHSHKL